MSIFIYYSQWGRGPGACEHVHILLSVGRGPEVCEHDHILLTVG